jgi:glycosyltransferase involved in cell wall biosynthesis
MDLWPLNRSCGIDLTRQMLKIKHKIFRNNDIHVVAPCEWMATTARSSGIPFKRLTVIPYGVDASACPTLEKGNARQSLGLTTRKPIVLLSAGDLADKRKGMIYAIQALKILRGEIDPFVLVVGQMAQHTRQMFGDIEVLQTGYLRDDTRKIQYFAAADVFLFCPLDDNMPLTILETMAVATPMVGFATGGIPEVVEHLRTGYLVAKGEVEKAAHGLRRALSEKGSIRWGFAGREKVLKQYTHEIFLENHLKVYGEMVG